ncbi:hypothetical protein OB955_14360 [Halobacteria archaeon AArc-m2/3/4]|uniref:Uncharacterized protein n=1 Tax=Natronoglomus mannanivorans TaxID=2979990 RepID=A0AAP3E4B3_9EURY|nr:hypothetical protein [Halobacteria archaeon AArc-xg1-1]MCU4973916.1 hypothetical protein [Halobacteria archaeon AArc-m2/3/4]
MTTTEQVCHVGIFVSLTLLSIGVAVDVVFGTSLLDFLLILAGLFVGWVSFLYCLGRSPVWD